LGTDSIVAPPRVPELDLAGGVVAAAGKSAADESGIIGTVLVVPPSGLTGVTAALVPQFVQGGVETGAGTV
jgi:hypothetical protein